MLLRCDIVVIENALLDGVNKSETYSDVHDG